MPLSPFNLSFGSMWAYCPKGTDEVMSYAKNIMLDVKNEKAFEGPPRKTMSERVAEFISENIKSLPFKDFFGSDVSLIPVPKSSLMKVDTLWVPERISIALAKKSLGIKYSCLVRRKSVAKSSTSKPAERPKAIDHYNSIDVNPLLHRPKKIVLIDDVVTRGATFIGCAGLLREKFPDVPILAFAVIRTISEINNFKSYQDPCIGNIILNRNGETRRDP